MVELDTRQMVTVGWFLVIIAGLLLYSRTRVSLASGVLGLLKVMANWKIIVPLAVYFSYATLIVSIAYFAKLWTPALLVDTLIIVFFVGLPMFINAHKGRSGYNLVHKALHDTVGLGALLAFYIGLVPLSLIGEVILQPIVTLLVVLSYFSGRDARSRSIERIINTILGAIGLWLIIRTINIIMETWHIDDIDLSLSKLLLSIILPLSLLPLIYVFALIMRYEIILLVAKNFAGDKGVPKFVHVAILAQLNAQLASLNELGGIWLQKLVQSDTRRGAEDVLKELKKAIRNQRRKSKDRARKLRDMKGKTGVDEAGLQLDRREFYESKNDLENLLYTQKGQFNTRNYKYNPDLPIQLGFSKLPTDHGIAMTVRNDRKAWLAWRRMPNGYYFGVGGSADARHVWLYESSKKPVDFPSKNRQGWSECSSGIKPPEWQFDDTPPRVVVPESYFNS